MAPFVVAIAPLALCGVLIVQNWSENYGNRQSKLVQSCMDGLKVIIQVRIRLLYPKKVLLRAQMHSDIILNSFDTFFLYQKLLL